MKVKSNPVSRSRARGSNKKSGSNPDRNNRRQAGQSLQEYQAILDHAEEVAKLGSWKWDLRTKKVTWSEGMFRLFGVDREGFDGDLSQIIPSRIHPGDMAAVNESNRRVLEEGVSAPMSYRIVLPEGTERTVWAEGKLLYDENGQPRALTGYVQDMSERVQAERKILQLQRLYATLSQVNQVIVRARERDELFQKICDVAVEFGGFTLAWVGLLDELSGELRPVASRGWDIHHWPFPTLSIYQEEYKSTLTATAIRTASVVTSENIHTDERLQSFHSQVAPYPYYASAIVPLKLREQVIGILALCSPEKGVFQDQAEVTLLEEMAADISFALDNMDTEQERRQAEKALQESENRYRDLVETSNDAIFINRQGQIAFINRRGLEMFGATAYEQVVGRSPLDFFHPDFHALVMERIKQLLIDQVLVPAVEEKIITLEGRLIPVEVTASRVLVGGIPSIQVILREITERKRTEERLRQSEERYRLISENTADVIWVLDPLTGRLKYVSPSVEKLSGFTPAEVMESPISELLTPESLQRINELLAKFLPAITAKGCGKDSFTAEVDHPRRDGSIVHTEVTTTCMFNQQGEVEIIGVSRDITERRRAEQALRENEERLRLSLQAANQGFYDLNIQTGEAVVNREYAEMLGYEYGTFMETNASWIERLHPDDREITAKAYADYVGGLRPDYRVEFRQKAKDGSWKWILSLGKVIEYDEQGAPLRMLGTHTDITERKQAEEVLRESEARFSKIFQASPMGILIFRLADGHAVNINEAALKTMGYSREEILGHMPQDLNIFPDGNRAFNEAMSILSRGEAVRNQDVRIRRPSGEIRDVLGSLELMDLNGEKMVMVITSDITERKRTEQELRASEERYRNLIENMNDLVMEVDANGNYCYLSPNYASISEYPLEDELGGSALKHIHPDDLPMVLQKLEQAFTMERQSATYRVKRNNGEWRWLETVGKPYHASDGSIHFITVARDITERKQAEEALKKNEHVLRLFVEHSPASIAMFDRDMRYIVASRRYLADYRLGDQELTGRSHYDVFPEIPESWKQIHRRCLQGAVEKEEEDPFPREDGTLDWVRWEIRPWYEETGVVGGIILFSEVITERKQIQDNLRLLNVSLEQRVTERTMELSYANRAKDEFLANMSHELRTPLNAILGLSESLLEQRRGPLNERQVQSIELVASSGKHLLNLINDILEVSKIEAGRLDLRTDVVSVKELCTSSLTFIKELALKKLIGLEFTYQESVSTFQADPQRVKQILINLLTNAVKFTPERGRVRLDVSTNPAGDRILFSVTDTGIGIAREDLKKLFTPFTQLDSSLARQYAGTGLGLSLVQKLTEAHGGSVEVESEPGQGSRFTVILPLKQSSQEIPADDRRAPSAEMEQGAAAGISPNNTVVLLAEDNQVNSEMILTYLGSFGYTALAAQNGEEVLQMVEEITPDIILMDIQMPKMDGLETTRRLRRDPRFAATPIIALTALVMPGDRERCFEAGVNEYLSKPVSLKALVSVIEKLTG